MATYLLGTPKKSGVFTYLTNNVITNPYGNKTKYGTEVGVDFHEDFHTAMYALTSGPVVGAAYLDCPGGVLAVESLLPINGTQQVAVLYYQHMDIIDSSLLLPGAVCQRGQLIGYSGGQLSGGYHNNQEACSNGPHIEIGINPQQPWPWNPNNRTPHVDPTHILAQLVQGEVSSPLLAATTAPGFLPIAQMLDDAQRWRPFPGSDIGGVMGGFGRNASPVIARGIFVLIGLLLVTGVLWNLLRPAAEEVAGIAAQAAKEAAPLAEVAA